MENAVDDGIDKKNLYDIALRAAEKAYAPYSKYRVGAAVLTAGGKIFTGANIENASYSAGICAERVAASKAISEGERDIAAIAIATENGRAMPCGICRQFLSEFNRGLLVITGTGEDDITVKRLDELLPFGFEGPEI